MLAEKIIIFFKNEYNQNAIVSIKQNLFKKEKSIISIKIFNLIKYFNESEYFEINDKISLKKNWLNKQNQSDIYRAYFCGIFLSGGSVNSPETSNYHLELIYHNLKNAELDQEYLKSFGFEFKLYEKIRNHIILYIKKSLVVSDFLKFLDAPDGVIKFEQIRINRDFKNSKNRIINIEASNQKKIIQLGIEQIQNIKFLVENDLFNNLSYNIKELCLVRLDYESSSYFELSEILEKKGIILSKSRIAGIFSEIKKITKNKKEIKE